METQQVRQMILNELPKLMQSDTFFRESVISIARTQFADKAETESRFDKMMARFDRLMDEDRKKWEENQKQFAAINTEIKDLSRRLERKIEEDHQNRLEDQRKWKEQQQISERKWEENQRESKLKWEENQRESKLKWEENQRKWEENQREFRIFNRKHDQLIGAAGRRWGLQSEASFRNALTGILKDFQGVEVINVVEQDDAGVVFGHPDQIELDIIIRNGVLIVCELKSSVSKSDMYIFERKVRFYEQKQTKLVNRKLIISPFVDTYAMPVADKLGIEVYSYVDDVNL